MDAYSEANGCRSRPGRLLDAGHQSLSSGHSVGSPPEYAEPAVAFSPRPDDRTGAIGKNSLDDLVVADHRKPHWAWRLFPKLSRADHVGEDESDSSVG